MERLRPRSLTELWAPKAGNSPEEYEDAFRAVFPEHAETDTEAGEPDTPDAGAARVAVADGASESAFAREWANALAGAFASAPPDLGGLTADSLDEWLRPAREEWREGVPWDDLPWHGEAKARAGAFATLLGLTIEAAPDGDEGDEGDEDGEALAWRALAVGDSCLFIVRDGRLAVSFPLEDAAEFGNTPVLVCSNPDNAENLWNGVSQRSGDCEAGDRFILASDAIACWFLAADAAGEKPWETIAALAPPDWDGWVEDQRRAGLMRNDDVTLLALEVA